MTLEQQVHQLEKRVRKLEQSLLEIAKFRNKAETEEELEKLRDDDMSRIAHDM